MPRKPLIRSNVLPYHVVNQVNNREWFPMELREVWEIFATACLEIELLFGARIHAFVLMANHYHMVLTSPDCDIGAAMKWFAESVTRTFNRKSGREGHLFKGKYRATLVDSPIYYSNVIKYVYRNPIKAGVVKKVEDYPYSTLHGLLGRAPLPFPIFVPENGAGDGLMSNDVCDWLFWLNEDFSEREDLLISKGLRKPVFKIPKRFERSRVLDRSFERMIEFQLARKAPLFQQEIEPLRGRESGSWVKT